MNVFIPGAITFLLDQSFGSSAKGATAARIVKHTKPYSTKANFLVTSNSANASHRVVDGDKDVVFKVLPSGSLYHEKLEKVFITAGASFSVDALFEEINKIGIPKEKIAIHPCATIITQADVEYERGNSSWEGEKLETRGDGTMKAGSTCSGSGAAFARKALRHKHSVKAKDVKELEQFIAPVEVEIMERLRKFQSGLFEIGQGFPLSLNHWRFAPHTTFRNVTVSSALNDAMIPPYYAGPVILNLRTYPIRINSKKYITKDGRHLTWDEVQSGQFEYEEIDANSGHWYPDQTELTWDYIEKETGPIPDVIKNTTLTKLPRRVATFSPLGLQEAIDYNKTHHPTFLSLNFINWVDKSLESARGSSLPEKGTKAWTWIENNLKGHLNKLIMLGTSPQTDDFIDCTA